MINNLKRKWWAVNKGTVFTTGKANWVLNIFLLLAMLKMASEVTSSDMLAADAFKPMLKKRIEEEEYDSNKVTYFDKRGLY